MLLWVGGCNQTLRCLQAAVPGGGKASRQGEGSGKMQWLLLPALIPHAMFLGFSQKLRSTMSIESSFGWGAGDAGGMGFIMVEHVTSFFYFSNFFPVLYQITILISIPHFIWV